MIVDTSVLAAILFDEPEKPQLLRALASASLLSMSAGNWLELTSVLARRGRIDLIEPTEWLRDNFTLAILTVSPEQAELGRAAYVRFGRGSRHPADLNFGDCFSYALAKATGEPLLFKGDDFNHTDLLLAPEAAYPR